MRVNNTVRPEDAGAAAIEFREGTCVCLPEVSAECERTVNGYLWPSDGRLASHSSAARRTSP